jgi:hypothetical protein
MSGGKECKDRITGIKRKDLTKAATQEDKKPRK